MSRSKVWSCVLMAVVVFVNPRPTAAQSLREVAREQARKNPGVPLLQTSSPGHYLPRTIEELTKEAEVVLLATLSQMNSYLSPDEKRVHTDYAINVERVIAGSVLPRQAQTPGVIVPPLVLMAFGGDVTVEGVLIRSRDVNLETFKDGGRYLLFLMKGRRQGAGRYETYYGGVFEILQERARPLLRDAQRVFGDAVDAPIRDLIPRIEKAGQGR